jgi:uncharacterized protein YodC (DUF2158 family)
VSKKKKANPGFVEGEVVSLNIDGAPAMIVYAVEGTQVTCDWFDGKTLCRQPFHEKQLVSATSSASTRDMARAILTILREATDEPKPVEPEPVSRAMVERIPEDVHK